MIVVAVLGALLITLAAVGIAYQVAAALAVSRTLGMPATTASEAPPAVTLLKPLHGLEPQLAANLGGFDAQD